MKRTGNIIGLIFAAFLVWLLATGNAVTWLKAA